MSDFINNPTRWSLVWRAGHGSTTEMRAALEDLCRGYWYPVYAYVRRLGCSAADSEDITQSFFHFLIAKNWFSKADPQRGRLRNLLLVTLKRFTQTEWRRNSALKRGAGFDHISLDGAETRYSTEPADTLSPDRLFQRQWAVSVLEQAVLATAEEYRAAGNERVFQALRGHLGLGAAGAPEEGYAEISEALGMTNGAVRTAAHRLRTRFRSRLLSQVAQTIDTGDIEEIRAEIRELMECV